MLRLTFLGHLSGAKLAQFPLPTPRLPEQRQIAAILDTIDDAIRKTEQIIAKLKQVKRGLLHDLLTRGIDDNGELRDPERHPEQFKDSPLGRIPKEWEITTLSALCAAVVDCPHSTVFCNRWRPLVVLLRTAEKSGRFALALMSASEMSGQNWKS